MEDNMEPVLVGEEIVSVRGSLLTARRYYAGWWPHLGLLHNGWSGQETVVEGTFLRPLHTFQVLAVEVELPPPQEVYLSPVESLSVAV